MENKASKQAVLNSHQEKLTKNLSLRTDKQ